MKTLIQTKTSGGRVGIGGLSVATSKEGYVGNGFMFNMSKLVSAILDRFGSPIADRFGNYIVGR